MSYEDSSGFDEDSSGDAGWVQWYCGMEGHDFYVEVDEDYIQDNFNLYGLKALIKNFDKALETLLGSQPQEEEIRAHDFLENYKNIASLYGLIHARYILSPRGLMQMKEKLLRGTFGKCPRVLCEDEATLPVGLSEELCTHRVRVYCPKCQEVYDPLVDDITRGGLGGEGGEGRQNSRGSLSSEPNYYAEIDGAFFGPSFPHFFLQTYPALVPLDAPKYFKPRVFGFKVHGRKSTVQIKLERGDYGDSLIPRRIRRNQNQTNRARQSPLISGQLSDVDARGSPNAAQANGERDEEGQRADSRTSVSITASASTVAHRSSGARGVGGGGAQQGEADAPGAGTPGELIQGDGRIGCGAAEDVGEGVDMGSSEYVGGRSGGGAGRRGSGTHILNQ